MKDQDRLEPVAYELLLKTDAERIVFILKDKWIGYTAAKDILLELEELLLAPKRQRRKFILIEAKSGNGKTTLLKHFLNQHPKRRLQGDLIAPVIYIEAPSGPSVEELYANILFELGSPLASTTLGKKLQLKILLPKVETKMLLIDNFHDFKYGNSDLRKKFIAAVRKLASEADINISIVATATEIARNVISGDAQTYSRFRFRLLPSWSDNNEFRNLLHTFERILPLKKTSGLADDDISRRILIMSDGILANVEEILQDAATMAIVTGKERIDGQILKEISFNTKHQPQPNEKSEYSEDYIR